MTASDHRTFRDVPLPEPVFIARPQRTGALVPSSAFWQYALLCIYISLTNVTSMTAYSRQISELLAYIYVI